LDSEVIPLVYLKKKEHKVSRVKVTRVQDLSNSQDKSRGSPLIVRRVIIRKFIKQKLIYNSQFNSDQVGTRATRLYCRNIILKNDYASDQLIKSKISLHR
jgi:hypothetical protein